MIQNSHTSLLPIYSTDIPPGGTAIVYLSTTTNVGQVITIRDMDGYLSSPQQILISTTPGATLDGAAAAVSLRQGFAYLTLRSSSTSNWKTMDTSAFPDPSADYTLRGIAYSSFTVSDSVVLKGSTITTGPVSTLSGTFSTLLCGGQTTTSTLQVNTASSGARMDASGISFTTSSFTATGPVSIEGTLNAANSAIGASVSSLQGAAITGTMTTSTLITTGEVSTNYSVSITGVAAIGGTATVGSARITRNGFVPTFTTNTLQTGVVSVDQLIVSTPATYRSRTDIPIVDPSYTSTTNPTVFADAPQATPTLAASWLGTSTFITPQLTISTAISSANCSQVLFTAANITNSDGSIAISSAQIGTATLSNTVIGPAGTRIPLLGTATATISSAQSQFEVKSQILTTPISYTTLLNADIIQTSTVNTGTIAVSGDSFTFSTVFISSGLVSNELSSIVAITARIQNTTGQTRTSSLLTSSIATSSIHGVQTINALPLSTLTFSTPSITISSARTSTATAIATTTSSFQGSFVALGGPLLYSTIGPTDPWISTSTVSGVSTNTPYEYIQGIGTPYQPLRIHASLDRTVNLYLRNVSSFASTFFTANMTYRNDSSISGVAGLRIVNMGGTSTLLFFNANPIVGFQKQTLSNYPIDQSTAPSTTTYWLAGPNTLSGPSTIESYPQVVAGGTGPSYIALNAAGDTAAWSAVPSPPFTTATYALTWNGSNRWLAGGSGTYTFAYSETGSNWYGFNTGLFSGIRSVAWNGNLWIAGGTGTNTLAYSYDGLNWTGLGTSLFTTQTNAVAWNGSMWLAGGTGTSNSMGYSYDGKTWIGLGFSPFVSTTYGITWAPSTNIWVATGGPGTTQVAYSRTGTTWTPGTISTFVNANSYGYCVGWNGSQFIAGGDSNILYSADGQSWTKVGISSIMSTVRAVSWATTKWCIGGTFTTHSLATSPNAATWTGITASTLFTTAYAVQSRTTIPIDLSATDLLLCGDQTLRYATTNPTLWTPTSVGSFTTNGLAIGRDTAVAATTPSTPDPSGAYLVAVSDGGSGLIYYSTDTGTTWTSTGKLANGYGVAFSGSLWVAVVSPGYGSVLYSTNGLSWSNATIPSGSIAQYFKVAYGNGRWIVVGNATNSVITSTDGITWTTLTNATTLLSGTFGTGVTYSGGLWIIAAGGVSSPNSVIYSYDGLNWAVSTTASASFRNQATKAAWNGSRWVLVGNATPNSTHVMYSDDGIVWYASASAVAILGPSNYANSVATNGTTWVVSYIKGAQAGVIYSTDGINWTDATSVNTLLQRIWSLLWNGSTFIGVGQGTTNNVFSTDGINWTSGTNVAAAGTLNDVACRVPIPIFTGQTLLTSVNRGQTWRITEGGLIFTEARAVAWNGYLWVAVGDANTDAIAYSLDGITWTGTTGTTLATGFRAVAWDGAAWYVYGTGDNAIATSTDGINWTGRVYPALRSYFSIASSADGTRLVAVDSAPGYIYTSTDSGQTWTRHLPPGQRTWYGIAISSDGIKLAAAANNDYIWTFDGTTWTERTSSGQRYWTSIACSADGTTLVAGNTTPFVGGYLYTSYDSGETWTERTDPGNQGWYGITISSDGTKVAAAALNNYIYTSTDSGATWTQRTGAGARIWYSIAGSSDGTKLIVGEGSSGYIYTSTDSGATWTEQTGSGVRGWRAVASSANGIRLFGADFGGYVYTSTDSGMTWTPQLGSGTKFRNAIACSADGTKVATIAGYVYTSSDGGITWTEQSSLLAPSECAAWNGSNLWIGGADVGINGNTLLTSVNGIVWTGLGSTTFDTIVRAVAYNGSNWVAVGGTNTSLATSVNGTSWTANATTLDTASGVVWSGKTWVAVGTSTIATAAGTTAATATTWSTFTVSTLSTGCTLASANPLPYGFADSNIMFAASSRATTRLAISMNGTAWIPISSITERANTVSWNGRFWTFGLGLSPAIRIMSSNFILSTPTQTSFNLSLTRGIAWGPQLGLAVGQGASSQNIAYTTDGGLSWSADRNNTSPYFFFDTIGNAIAFGGNSWVAVGQDSTLTQSRGIRYSANGINWSTPSTTAGRGILLGCAVGYYSSLWLVGGSTITGTTDTLAVSENGSSWTYLSNTIFSVAARGFARGPSRFVAVGEGTNTIAYSSDGSNWTGLGSNLFTTRGRSVAWNGKYFVALGEGTNTIAYSSDGITWTGQGTSTFNSMSNDGGIASRSPLPLLDTATLAAQMQTPAKTFTWSLTGITELSQTSVQKPAIGTSAWNARAASVQAFTASVWLSFQPAQTTAEIMFGLSENPTATTSYTSLNYAFYMTSTASLRIYELGVQVAIVGAYQTTDTLRITYDGTTIRYYQNSTLVRSVARAVGAGLYMSSSFYTPTGTIQAVDFHPLYTLSTTKPALSTTGYAVSQIAGTQVDQFGPFYLTLTSNLLPSLWTFYATLDGTATSTNSLYADIFINETKYFSTGIINPVYSTLSTYTLSFSNATAVSISTPALLDVRFRAIRSTGNTYLYTNWTDGVLEERSSATIQNTYNPNGIEYLQFFHTSFNSGLQTSELDIYVSQYSTLSTYINSNVGIDIYSGFVRWNTPLNSITIENRYNDTTTRSLTYTGALYNASDPRLKEDITVANGPALYETLASLPLRRYRFIESYKDTYRVEDTTQLGVLTTELAPLLPDAVRPGPAGIDTVDRAQLRFAHLAATRELLARISTLHHLVLNLRTPHR